MNRKLKRVIGVSLLILTLIASMATQTASAITLKKVTTWMWGIPGGITSISSIATGDVDGDGKVEIVTGGTFLDGLECHNAQLCVWDGATLALENVRAWKWGTETWLYSVAVGDVDGDGKTEIVTGGDYSDESYYEFGHAQLVVWDGATLTVKKAVDWHEENNDTSIRSVAVADVDGDGKTEIVTGGNLVTRHVPPVSDRTIAQVCVWDGATLALENEWRIWILLNWWINSVAVGDVDGDSKVEIVTGGYFEFLGDKCASLWVLDGATLLSEKAQTWSWSESTTVVNSVAVLDSLFTHEIVTGGTYYDGYRYVAQLVVWDGATLAVNNVQSWDWGGTGNYGTQIESVAIGDVDGSIFPFVGYEIVTGGFWYDGTNFYAQLCVWSGALTLKDVKVWSWGGSNSIDCVAAGNVDDDTYAEIVNGGDWYNGYEYEFWAQLCVWDW